MIQGFFRFSDYCSLRTALVISMILPLAIAMGLTGYLVLGHVEKKVEERMQKDLELVARAIQLPLSHSLELDRQGSVLRAVESAFSIGRVYSAYVYDREGQRIASAGRIDTPPKERLQEEKLTALAADGKERGEYGQVAGREVFSYFVPLTDSGGRVNGLLQLTRRKSDIQEDIRAIRLHGGMGLGLGLLCMTVLVLFGHHRALGRHFSSLTRSMSRVAAGERNHRFELHGPREMMAVGRQFNQMLDSIAAAQSELRERRRRQEQLQARLRQAEKLAAIGQLAAGVAHELGTPLGVVSGKAQRALRRADLDADLVTALNDIRGEVDRMEHIIRQLLDFSRSNPLRKTPVLLGQLAHDAALAVAGEAQAGGVRMEVQEQEADEGDIFRVSVDIVRLEQTLVNLLRNALQAVGKDGRVLLSWGRNDRWAWMQVEDNGPGIPESIQARVFEPFFTTKSVGAGTGLGLAVVHGILQDHGGSVAVAKSELGGACFRIWLPLEAPNHARKGES